MLYVIEIIREDENQCVYKVQRASERDSKVREIVDDKALNFITCSCKEIEFEGIPCRHILAYFNKKQIICLPNIYILRRWTKNAKSDKVIDEGGMEVKDVCDKSFLMRRNNLFQLASNLINDAVVCEEASEMLREHLESIREKIKAMTISKGGGVSTKNNIPRQQIFNEPHQVRAKGCGKRLKGGKEKAKDQSRRCHGCGLTGQSHDKRNCPKLNNRSFPNDNNGNPHDVDANDELFLYKFNILITLELIEFLVMGIFLPI